MVSPFFLYNIGMTQDEIKQLEQENAELKKRVSVYGKDYQTYIKAISNLLLDASKVPDFSTGSSKAIKSYIKKFIVYALDVKNISSEDIKSEALETINQKLRMSKFMTKRKKLRGVAIERGLSAMVFSIVNQKVYFDVYKVLTPFSEVADQIKKIYVYKDYDTVKDGEIDRQVYYQFKTTDGMTLRSKYVGEINGKPSSFELASDKESEYPIMPVVVLPNNEDYESTFEDIEGIIEAAGKHLNNINKEWEFDKSIILNNTLLNPGRTGEQLEEDIASGKKQVFDERDPNGMAGGSMRYLSSGGISSQVAQRNYDKFKQEALFYALSWLVVSDGKTNKHGAEVITSQLPTFNHIQYQVELLNEFYSHFMFILHNLMIETGELKNTDKLDTLPRVDVELSKYMEAILSMGNKDGENNAFGGDPNPKPKGEK